MPCLDGGTNGKGTIFWVDLDFSHLRAPKFCPCITKKRHVMGLFWSLGKYFGLVDVWVLWKFLHLDEPAQEGELLNGPTILRSDGLRFTRNV